MLALALICLQVTLGEVSVTSRRMADAGIERTTLDSAQLRQSVAYSMADVLTKGSTLYVKSYGRATESTAEFRGTSPSHTQVLWNGLRINSPMLGTVDFSYIPSHFVDSVTLLHGASSLTHTGGGLGGAVLLDTKPAQRQGWGCDYTQGIGSFLTFDEMAALHYSNGKVSSSTRLSLATSRNDFAYTNYDKIADGQHPTERNKSGEFADINALQDVHWLLPSGDRVKASAWWAHSTRGLPFLSVDYKDDTDFTNQHTQQTLNAAVAWQRLRQRWTAEARAGYSALASAYDYSTTRGGVTTQITNSRSQSHTAMAEGAVTLMPSASLLLSATGRVLYCRASSQDRSPMHTGENYDEGRPEASVCLSASWRPLDRLTLRAVAREESYGAAVAKPVPAVFAEYVLCRPLGLTVKASAARNYRYPTLSDLYFQPGGNPDLRPEQGVTEDCGIELTVRRPRLWLHANVAAFNSIITDWILWTPNSKGYWQPSNVKRVHSYGVECQARAAVTLPHQWAVAARGCFAYTPAINLGERANSNDESYGKQLCYVPRASANLSLTLSWRRWQLQYDWTHYGERYTTTSNDVSLITGRLLPYYMSDVSLCRPFRLRRARLTAKAAVLNLLGTEYVTVLSRPMPGRHWQLSATFHL